LEEGDQQSVSSPGNSHVYKLSYLFLRGADSLEPVEAVSGPPRGDAILTSEKGVQGFL